MGDCERALAPSRYRKAKGGWDVAMHYFRRLGSLHNVTEDYAKKCADAKDLKEEQLVAVRQELLVSLDSICHM